MVTGWVFGSSRPHLCLQLLHPGAVSFPVLRRCAVRQLLCDRRRIACNPMQTLGLQALTAKPDRKPLLASPAWRPADSVRCKPATQPEPAYLSAAGTSFEAPACIVLAGHAILSRYHTPRSATAASPASRSEGSGSTRMKRTPCAHFGGSPKCSCQFSLQRHTGACLTLKPWRAFGAGLAGCESCQRRVDARNRPTCSISYSSSDLIKCAEMMHSHERRHAVLTEPSLHPPARQ